MPDATIDLSVPNAAEYVAYWKKMVVDAAKAQAVDQLARAILTDKARYRSIERVTGVPWYMVSVIHQRESDRDWDTYLGNGQSIHRVTTIVPKGRGPFGSFEAGAIDAFDYDGLSRIKSWPIERCAYECERFNGMGYRGHGVPSAYLWSWSNIYRGGKYVSDGVWSSSARDAQCGTMPILQTLAKLDPSIQFGEEIVKPSAPTVIAEDQPFMPLLHRVIAGMMRLGYKIDKEPGHVNTAYAEGYNRDGVKNDNRPGFWNDVRLLWTYAKDKPVLGGAWTATTQPGPYYTENPINSGGAANIFPGQYAAWKVGLHRGQYEALVQRGAIKLTRDKNKDYRRVSDVVEVGDYEGINQHHGSNASEVGQHSAGCLVGRMVDGHEDFMRQAKKDPRYLADHDFMFTTAILSQDQVPDSVEVA